MSRSIQRISAYTASAILFLLLALAVPARTGPNRRVAVTIDDLPVVSKFDSLEVRQSITRQILGHLKKRGIPAVGFVNEHKLYGDGELLESEVDLLKAWLDSGQELGNHTFRHRSLHDTSVAEYLAGIAKGERVTRRLMDERRLRLRYFRHPFLHTGIELGTKGQIDVFLAETGYAIAPVSMDTSDWIFARAYDNTAGEGDKALHDRIAAAYVPYLVEKAKYWERQSEKLFDRNIDHILLLHANSINAELLGDVTAAFESQGYEFITLEQAISDEAYRNPDRFTGRAGISWLHRWALERGREFLVEGEPRVPEFVMKAAGVDSE